MIVEVRPAVEADYDAVAALTLAAYEIVFDGDLGDYGPNLADVARRAREALVLVATAGTDVVGSVTYVPGPGPYFEFEGDRNAGIRMVAVAPEVQGRGVGKALVLACIEQARAEHRERLLLHTTAQQVVAQRMYENLGFRRSEALDVLLPDYHLMGYELDLSGSLDPSPGGEMGRR